ncbi:hypothetical protein CUR178_01039 [Leishmania enriettii]|uniref:Uncharacterized protein n=1 Tax=Leishmania enriettii TaxID=5663 RepID=A0A836GYC9_LEIEN|nr:hypothetical protein CUR178_01039 [Leishmania enriettii]
MSDEMCTTALVNGRELHGRDRLGYSVAEELLVYWGVTFPSKLELHLSCRVIVAFCRVKSAADASCVRHAAFEDEEGEYAQGGGECDFSEERATVVMRQLIAFITVCI